MKRKLILTISLLFTLCALQNSYAQTIIRTIAGNGTGGNVVPPLNGDGGLGRAAVISRPDGIAVDKYGNIYIADYINNNIRKLNTNGIISTWVNNTTYPSDSAPEGSSAFNAYISWPWGLTVDTAANLYFADASNLIIQKVTPGNQIYTFAGVHRSPGYSGDNIPAFGALLNGASSVSIDDTGNIYISDNTARVRKVTHDGLIHTVAGNGSIGYAGNGVSATNPSAAVLAMDGVEATCVDHAGNIYICDVNNQVVRKVTASTGLITLFAGVPGTAGFSGDGGQASAAKLYNPADVKTDAAGNVYIVDQGNNRIRKVDHTTGVITTICGTGSGTTSNGFAGDGGPPTAAKLSGPAAIWIDTAGRIFIADESTGSAGIGHRIREIYTPGTIHITNNGGLTSVCDSNITFTANTTIAGYGAVYKWKKNGTLVYTSNLPTYTTGGLVTGNQISCTLVDTNAALNLLLATSDTLTLTVTGSVNPTVSITATADTLCAGTTATFNASTTFGGASPLLQWYINNTIVGAGATYTYTPANGDSVWCKLTSSATCALPPVVGSNAHKMYVRPQYTPTINIHPSTSSDTVCLGTALTITADTAHAGTSPTYQWYINGSIAGGSTRTIPYTPSNGDSVRCIITGNYVCPISNTASSNTLTFVVNPLLPPSVSFMVAGGDSACATSLKTFTATGVNGGSTPVFHWFVNGVLTGTGNPYVYAPANGDVVNCVLRSSACVTQDSVSSASQTITMIPLSTPLVTISSTATTACAGTAITFTATGTNTGTTPIYSWRVNGTAVALGASYTYAPSNGDVVVCRLSSNVICPSPDSAISAPISMAITPIAVPSVNIAADAGYTVCAGTLITFTPSPVNGGATPAYTWYKNGVASGSGNNYAVSMSVGDVISCSMTSSAACAAPATVSSNVVALSVLPLLTPGISITSTTGNIICDSSWVTLLEADSNTGTAPVYSWVVNGVYVGAGIAYTYRPANGDNVVCTVHGNQLCPSPDSAVSAPIIFTVKPILHPSISISTTSPDTICSGTIVTYTVSATDAGSSPTFVWQRNGSAFSSGTTAVYSPADGAAITCMMIGSACSIPASVVSDPIVLTVLPSPTPAISIAVSPDDTVCTGATISLSSSIMNGGDAPVYNWYVNGASVATDTAYSYIPVNGDVVSCSLISNAICANPDSVGSNLINITVLTDTTPVVTITAVNDTVCSGTYATFTATLSGSISTAVYDWQVNGFSLGSGAVFSYIPNDGDVVKCELFVFTPCSSTDTASIASNEVTLSVTPSVLPALSVSGSADTVCAGTTVTFSVDSSVNAGTAPLFTWYRNGIVDGSGTTYSTTPLMGDAVFCMLTSNAICAIPPSVFSDTLTEYVRPLITPSITVTAFPGDTVCDGTSVSFSETDANTGSIQSYYWTVNGIGTGDTGTTLLYTPAYGDVVSCIVHGNQLCPAPDSAVSAPVTMILHHLLVPAVHIEATSDTVCAGTLVNFLSTVTNGGTHPDYHWSVNGIATGTGFGYTYTPMPGDTISCTVTSSEACLLVDTAVSNTIDMYVRPLLTPGISISAAPGDTVCAGTTVTFSAADTNTGTSPVYTWKKNGVNVGAGTSYAYSPANGDIITCVVHGNQLCPAPDSALSNTLTMTVNPVLTPGINLSMSTSDTICAGTTVTFTAHTVNGGTAPFYQWEVNGTDAGIDTFYTYIPTNGDIIACKLTSNAVCASVLNVYSAPDTMSVLPIIVPSVSVTSTAGDTVCAGTLVSYHATATGGGSTPVFNWIKNGTSAASGATYSFTPVAGDTVWCQLVSSGPCAQPDTATTGAMVIVVNPVVVPVISITSVPGDTVCAGTSVSFTAAITNGGPTPAFQWKKNGINAGTDTAYTYVPVNGDTITFTLISSAICAAPDTLTTNPIIMTVNPVLTPSIIISPSTGDTICAGTAVTFNSIAVNGGTAPAYHWLLNGLPTTSTGSNYNYIPANGDTISCVMISNAICADHDTVLSNNVVMNVVPVIVPAISITPTSDTVCAGTPVTFHLSEANGGNSPMYKWMVNALPSGSDTLLNYVPANGDVVSCVLVSSSNCALPDTAISNTVTLVVDSVLSSSVSITGNPGADITSGEADTFTAVAINAGSNPQFQWTVNGSTVAGATNAIFISATLHDNDTVRCTVINNSTCDTPAISVSNHIVIDLQNIPLAYDGVSLSPNPNNGTFTVTAHYTEKNGNTASIMIIDISGKQVWKSEVPVVNGVATATVDLSDLPAAMYMLRINYGDLDNSMKFVVHK